MADLAHPHITVPPLTADQQELADAFGACQPILEALRESLEDKARQALHEVPHVDRLSFRVKDRASFARKCRPVGGRALYADPLAEVEDQVAGRVIVFFSHDLQVVEERLSTWFTGLVEATKKRPERATEFGYESDHYILAIDEHLKPAGWYEAGSMPTTFELQIRTLFMHAWAEPQHDLGYKGSNVTDEHSRMLAWVAASAWGADRMFEDVWMAINAQASP